MCNALKRPLAALLILPLAGCSIPIQGPTTKGALESFRPLTLSRRDTCQTQREISEHNSRYQTLLDGKPTVYKAPCDVEKRVAGAPS